MKKYVVRIKETAYRDIVIEAHDEEDAEDIANDLYAEDEIEMSEDTTILEDCEIEVLYAVPSEEPAFNS